LFDEVEAEDTESEKVKEGGSNEYGFHHGIRFLL
jgi:hypothetical protein